MRPQILHRIELRSVSRKELQPQAPLLAAHKIPHQTAAMTPQPIPDNQQLPRKMSQKMCEELDHLRAADGAGKKTKVEVPPGDSGHGREGPPVEVVLQDGRFAARRPRATAMRSLTQSAFVDEDDGAALVFGLFFNCGQRSCFHRRIFSSSRSIARPVGRWQLHPNCRKIRHTCPGWY